MMMEIAGMIFSGKIEVLGKNNYSVDGQWMNAYVILVESY